jgi:hypothetical protein
MLDFCRALFYYFTWILFFSKISVNICQSLTFGLIYAIITQKFSQIYLLSFFISAYFVVACDDVQSTILAKYFATPVREIIL